MKPNSLLLLGLLTFCNCGHSRQEVDDLLRPRECIKGHFETRHVAGRAVATASASSARTEEVWVCDEIED
jgi:hypothetical protein